MKSHEEAERIFTKIRKIKTKEEANLQKFLSGGERRLLEISRALVMKTICTYLVDEPSIGFGT